MLASLIVLFPVCSFCLSIVDCFGNLVFVVCCCHQTLLLSFFLFCHIFFSAVIVVVIGCYWYDLGASCHYCYVINVGCV